MSGNELPRHNVPRRNTLPQNCGRSSVRCRRSRSELHPFLLMWQRDWGFMLPFDRWIEDQADFQTSLWKPYLDSFLVTNIPFIWKINLPADVYNYFPADYGSFSCIIWTQLDLSIEQDFDLSSKCSDPHIIQTRTICEPGHTAFSVKFEQSVTAARQTVPAHGWYVWM